MAKNETKERRILPARYNIFNEDGKVFLEMEMPGVSKEDLEIKVDGNHFMVNGKKTIDKISGKFRLHEIIDGDYQHIFTLDETIDRDKIEASVKNGIVTVALGIKESEKPRKIKITAK
ncbi:MAG: Hsp20/alpha crystallin family protein [Spirochaetes bacterium]|nr:MAG: Hsp20/alpha crystallin family protein [Spirochaetota bacterium]